MKLIFNKQKVISKTLLQARSNLRESILLILAILLTIIWGKINIIYAVEHGKTALEITQSLTENNIQEAERLLNILRNTNFTETQMQEIKDILDRSYQKQYGNYPLRIPDTELDDITNFLVTLAIVGATFVIGYFVFHHWNEILNSILHVPPIQMRLILLTTFELVNTDLITLREMANYLDPLVNEPSTNTL